MTAHLSQDECFDAADGTLDAARLAHVTSCEACRVAVDDARAFVAGVAEVDVPEPSPLFWDHFSARVREATALETMPARSPWWAGMVRPVFAIGATAAMAVLAVWLVRQPIGNAEQPGSTAVPVEDAAASWDSVMELTAGWSADDLEGLVPGSDGVMSSGDASVLFIDELSGDERAAFARLLRDELAVVQ
jgi:hypothetical protein